MEQALQALLIAPSHRMRTSILYGGKTISIRKGHRDYRPGPVMLCCHLVPWAVMAEITSVRHCLLREITQEEYEADDFRTREAMVAGLQLYYPDLTLDSPVTVIRWDGSRLKGLLVHKKVWYRKKPEEMYADIEHDD